MGLLKLFQSGEGVLLALLAAVGFSAFPNLARLAADGGVPDLQVILVGELTCIAVFLPSALLYRTPLTGETHKQTLGLLGTGLMMVASNTMTVLAALYIPPAASIAVKNGSRPLFVAVIAWLALREPTGWGNAVGMAVQATGVGLVVVGTNLRAATLNQTANLSEPVNVTANVASTIDVTDDVTGDYVIGVVLVLVGTLGLAAGNVFNRAFLKKVPVLTVLLYSKTLLGLLVLPVMYIFNTPKWDLDITVVGMLSGYGVIFAMSVACVNGSLKLEKASTVAVLRGLSIALGYAFQYWILDVVPVLLEYIGASVIVVSIVVVGGRNWYKSYNSGTYEVESQSQLQTKSGNNISMTVEVSQGIPNPAMVEQNRTADDPRL